VRNFRFTLAFLVVLATGRSLSQAEESLQPLDEWNFKLIENLIWIRVKSETGAPLDFILDSASTSHVIDSETAARLDLPKGNEEITVRRTDCFENHSTTAPLTLAVDNTRLARTPLVVLPLNNPSSRQKHIDGILGSPLFEKYLVQIDYQESKIRLFSRDALPQFHPAVQHKLHSSDGLMGISLADASGRQGIFVVDTGSSLGVVVSSHATGFAFQGKPSVRTILAGGKISTLCYPETSWRVGDRTVSLETLCCKEAASGLLSDSRWSGTIGNRFLANFKVTFDWLSQRVFLQSVG